MAAPEHPHPGRVAAQVQQCADVDDIGALTLVHVLVDPRVHALAGSVAYKAGMASGKTNPTDYCRPRAWSQSSHACGPPAESARINTFLPESAVPDPWSRLEGLASHGDVIGRPSRPPATAKVRDAILGGAPGRSSHIRPGRAAAAASTL
ncbi:hypothetical protein BJY21_003090 [Kineosphaera limosa]|nr:hypothetical protein [Kineosphaera limosa]